VKYPNSDAAAVAFAGAIAGVAMYNQEAATALFSAETNEYEAAFATYVAQHSKSYGTKEEYQFRLAEFSKNMKVIENHNAQNTDSESLGLNHMADWTEHEYKKLLGFGVEKKKGPHGPLGQRGHGQHGHHGHHGQRGQHGGPHGNDTERRHLEESTVPDSVNWVTKGAVTGVKNQGSCGSCWSFSTTGSMEGRNQIKTGTLTSFSEQQFVDCSTTQGNMGCNGGLMDYAFTYAETTPIETEAQYPYKGRDGTCAAKGGSVEVKSFVDVTPKSPAALQAAVAEGPVSVAIDASSIFFQLYFGGIMKHFCGTSLDHGVLVVGYGTEKGQDYWMLKNSWGASWGEKGYFRMKRDAKEGEPGFCGLQLQASYPTF
jgi:C1A family cysteine protease